jgi:hypothetical protein
MAETWLEGSVWSVLGQLGIATVVNSVVLGG